MTDDRTLTDLDARARSAAAGVRTAVADRPVPVFDPDLVRIDVDARPERPSRSRPVVGLLAAAAAVLVVVAAVVALTAPGDDDSAPADRVGVDEAGRYVLGEVPDGFTLGGVLDTAEPQTFDPGSNVPVGPVAYYGPDERTPRLGVFLWPPEGPPGEVPGIVDDMAEVEIAGRRAWEATPPAGAGFVVEVDGSFVFVVGASAERSELEAVAGNVTVDGDRALVPDDSIPEGLSYLGEGRYLDVVGGAVAGLRSTDADERAWTATYLRQVDGEVVDAIGVSAALGSPVRVWAGRLATTDVEEVTVRGHDGLLARYEYPGEEQGALVLTWEERPGEIVQVSGLDTLGRDATIRLAEGLRTIEPDDVPALRRESMEAAAGLPGVTVVGRGTFTSGEDWLLLHSGEVDQVTLETTADDRGSSSTFSGQASSSAESVPPTDPDGDPSTTVPDAEGPPLDPSTTVSGATAALRNGVGYGSGAGGAWAYGLLRDDVAEVRVRGGSGDEVSVMATIVEADGVRGWVAELPASRGSDVPTYQIRAFAPDGTVLQTQDISA